MRTVVPVVHGSFDWIRVDAIRLAGADHAVVPVNGVVPSALTTATAVNDVSERKQDAHVAVYLQPGAMTPSSRRARVPLLLDSPHSGRIYPRDFRFAPEFVRLRRGEDAYVDRLIAPALKYGASIIAALFPRTYIDVNRHENDIDPALLASPWPYPVRPSEKTARGLGLLRRYVIPGVPVYAPDTRLTVAEVHARISAYYEPYLALLSHTIDALHSEFGVAYHIDFHSMKSHGNAMTPDGAGATRPDFVVGDLRGSACEPEFTEMVVRALEDEGWSVSVNKPYAGAGVLRRFGAPRDGVHCLQVEMNRALYLDEERVECFSDGRYERVLESLERVYAQVAQWTTQRALSMRRRPIGRGDVVDGTDAMMPSVARRLRNEGVHLSKSLLLHGGNGLLGDAGGPGEESDPDSNDDEDDEPAPRPHPEKWEHDRGKNNPHRPNDDLV
ncbi:hypothetical protein CDCA_CDCA16G4118 [Cyanidium caldarium]|uniref:N-formylglutamate amidohydrolase n=1 Tax=Cyanidium caldarium TaxID=2771 RepID=A0AAV9J0I5_CYACA|nr:hypothetical protein CDCA_CDCA16G4118 [Cyanidium caldarium]|eukprot:ctg_954.g328